MAAHKKQNQRVISARYRWRRAEAGSFDGGFLLASAAGGVTTDLVEHAARGHLNEPGARVFRQSVARPLLGRGQQGLLDGIFRGGEVVESADYWAEHLRRELTQQGVDVRARNFPHFKFSGRSVNMTRRTSIGMLSRASGSRCG